MKIIEKKDQFINKKIVNKNKIFSQLKFKYNKLN